jgi:predicted secreted protein
MHEKIHTGEREFKCFFEKCSMSFKFKSHLNDHINSHLKKKYRFKIIKFFRSFTCNICNLSFGRNFTLKNHFKKIHKKTKIFKIEKINLKKFKHASYHENIFEVK